MATRIQASNTLGSLEYKPVTALKTQRHSVRSITAGIAGTNNINEAKYWTLKLGLGTHTYGGNAKKYAHPRVVVLKSKGESLVQQVLFAPPGLSKTPPLAVISGPRVALYGTDPASKFSRTLSSHTTKRVIGDDITADRQVQVGGNVSTCGAFRGDGRLIAVGTDAGDLRICDVTMRATLATFITQTRLPVRCVTWLKSGKDVFTGSDDGVARLWYTGNTDKSRPVMTLSGHGDAIRSAAVWQESVEKRSKTTWWTDLAFTGSYDHTIRMWNIAKSVNATETEGGRCLSVLDHGAPVEALMVMKSNDSEVPFWLLSAGGINVKVWNPVSAACVHESSTRHRKTITVLTSVMRSTFLHKNPNAIPAERVVTAALDGTLQFHGWDAAKGTLEPLYSTQIDDAVTAVSFDESGDRIAIGTVKGRIHVHVRGYASSQKKRPLPVAGTFAYFTRGMSEDVSNDDFVVSSQNAKKPKLQSFDKALKEFRYSDALDDALSSRRPVDVIGVLEELGRKSSLKVALSNRDEETLEPILSFTTRYIIRPSYSPVLIGVAHLLLDIYSHIRGESETIDELFVKLKNRVSNEIRSEKKLLRVIGQIESVMADSQYE
mmetsp:Transcript_27497/g.77088  ORF Transcript_27497/g.77088 Transcript_27497/m.77088 type:complete len:604 (-) Transcript_27497:52-1863(-)